MKLTQPLDTANASLGRMGVLTALAGAPSGILIDKLQLQILII